MKLRCSRCGHELDTIAVRLESSVNVMHLSESGIMTPYTNFEEPTSELLCMDCFEKYCNCLNQLNEEARVFDTVDMVQIIDDIQYDSEDPDA